MRPSIFPHNQLCDFCRLIYNNKKSYMYIIDAIFSRSQSSQYCGEAGKSLLYIASTKKKISLYSCGVGGHVSTILFSV